MRKKYADCQRTDGDCTACSLVNYGRDCHNRPITKMEWSRRMAGMTQAQLAEASGVNIRQIQRVELGEAEAGNLTAKNLISVADALGVDARDLL
nr:MAG TPA: helix-turn-helix domain protein [Caudoviricetes sp.]DAP65670.1 MAG TPA: helix-turn-helix domain protein [Caudoviricetes sp.]DAX85567.1 MAG TPA: helix-turn-helix domain protein [Caudoviricetes sp.]